MTVLDLYVLKLLSCVRETDDSGGDLLSKFVQLLVSLFDLLIKSLIFDLQLLEIDQVETICKLLLLLQDLLLVGKSVSEGNVL